MKEAMKQAIEALENELNIDISEADEVQEAAELMCNAVKALKEALAKQEQGEAVAYLNPNLEHKAEEAECVTMCLNNRGIPTHDGDKDLSLWGRVEQYAKPRFLKGMATNSPQVSNEHLLAIAKMCKLIRSHTTKEIVDLITGYAQVVLNDKAVQEAFFKSNAHLLYTTPQQRKPLNHEQRFDLLTAFEPHKDKWEAPAILIDMVEAAHNIKE